MERHVQAGGYTQVREYAQVGEYMQVEWPGR